MGLLQQKTMRKGSVTSRGEATRDIKQDLKEHGKVFMAFRKELTPVIKEIVDEYLEEQKQTKPRH